MDTKSSRRVIVDDDNKENAENVAEAIRRRVARSERREGLSTVMDVREMLAAMGGGRRARDEVLRRLPAGSRELAMSTYLVT